MELKRDYLTYPLNLDYYKPFQELFIHRTIPVLYPKINYASFNDFCVFYVAFRFIFNSGLNPTLQMNHESNPPRRVILSYLHDIPKVRSTNGNPQSEVNLDLLYSTPHSR